MKALRFVFGCGLMFGVTAFASAQAPSGAPAGATGICKDGTYSNAASKSGACAGHKGVQTWYSATPAKTPAATKTATPMAPAPTPAASVPSRPAPTAAATTPSMPAPTRTSNASAGSAKKGPAAAAAAKTAQPGGGPGLVWVNTKSNVYHCYGDTYYGKTEAGAYMSEADAKAKGARGEKGKVCSK